MKYFIFLLSNLIGLSFAYAENNFEHGRLICASPVANSAHDLTGVEIGLEIKKDVLNFNIENYQNYSFVEFTYNPSAVIFEGDEMWSVPRSPYPLQQRFNLFKTAEDFKDVQVRVIHHSSKSPFDSSKFYQVLSSVSKKEGFESTLHTVTTEIGVFTLRYSFNNGVILSGEILNGKNNPYEHSKRCFDNNHIPLILWK